MRTSDVGEKKQQQQRRVNTEKIQRTYSIMIVFMKCFFAHSKRGVCGSLVWMAWIFIFPVCIIYVNIQYASVHYFHMRLETKHTRIFDANEWAQWNTRRNK